jgi:hypothetical protein
MGAVSFVVGVEGSTYTAPDEKSYELSGWTLGAIGAHEVYLEKRAEEAITRCDLPAEQKAAALVAHADRVATFKYSFGSSIYHDSLKSFPGLAHFFWQLARAKQPRLTLAEARALVQADATGVERAVYEADPQNRVTAEKTEDDAPAS